MTSQATDRYTAPAILAHWLMALMLVVSFGIGFYMVDLPFSPQRVKLFNWHKWVGITTLAFALLRLGWRVFRRPPAKPVMPDWQHKASRLVHGLMYVLFFAVPLAGWAYSSASGVPVVWLGLLPLPDLLPADKVTAQLIKPYHAALAWTLAVMVGMHLAAVVKHHFIDRDELLLRMVPRWGAAKDSS